MKKSLKKFLCMVMAIAMIMSLMVLPTAVAAEDDTSKTIVKETNKTDDGQLSFEMLLQNIGTLFAAQYDENGKMLIVVEVEKTEDGEFTFKVNPENIEKITFIGMDTDDHGNVKPVTEQVSCEQSIQVGDETFWTAEEAEEAAKEASEKGEDATVRIVGEYHGQEIDTSEIEGSEVVVESEGQYTTVKEEGGKIVETTTTFYSTAADELELETLIAGTKFSDSTLDNGLTRLEAAYLIADLLGGEASGTTGFTDVDPADGAVVSKVVSAGIMSGTNQSTFDPNGLLTRAQLATIICRLKGFSFGSGAEDTAEHCVFTDVAETAWYAKYVNILAWNGAFSEIGGEFKPTFVATQRDALNWLLGLKRSCVTTYDEFQAALKNTGVSNIAIKEPVTIPSGADTLTLNKNVFVSGNGTLTIASGATVEIPENVALYADTDDDSADSITINGTLLNNGTMKTDMVRVFGTGSSLQNTGVINPHVQYNGETIPSNYQINITDNGSLANFIGDKSGEIGGYIDFISHYYANGTNTGCTWDVLTGDTSLDIDGKTRRVVAYVADQSKFAEVVSAKITLGTGSEQITVPKYGLVIPCCTDSKTPFELGSTAGVTVPKDQIILLTDSVTTNGVTYTNTFALGEGNTLTVEDNGMIFGRGDATTIELKGKLNFCEQSIIDLGKLILTGNIIDSAEKAYNALKTGGNYYAVDSESAEQDEYEYKYYLAGNSGEEELGKNEAGEETTPLTVAKDVSIANFAHKGVALFCEDGFVVPAGSELSLNGINLVAVSDSTISGTVNADNYSQVIVQNTNNHDSTITIAAGGKLAIGSTTDRTATLAAYPIGGNEGDCNIVNYGTIELFGHKSATIVNRGTIVRPSRTANEGGTYAVIRDDDNSSGENNNNSIISDMNFTGEVTLICDTQYLEDGDTYGGKLCFENCTFEKGLRIIGLNDICFGVDLGDSCKNEAGDPVEVTIELEHEGEEAGTVDICHGSCEVMGNAFTIIRGEEESLTITDGDGYGAYVNVRMDENGEDENNNTQYIFTVELATDYLTETAQPTVITGNYFGKLRIGGVVDVSELSCEWIEVTGMRPYNRINIGGNTITMCDECYGNFVFTGDEYAYIQNINTNCYVSLNGLDFGQPHVFGENANGVYLPLNKSMSELQSEYGLEIKLYQGRWDNNWCNYGTEDGQIDYTPVSIDKEGKCAGEEGFDSENIVKMHLEPTENGEWITDPGAVCMTVTVNGTTAEFRPVQWKPIYASEFVERLNENINTEYELSSFSFEYECKEWDYLTIGTMKQILTTAYTDYYTAKYLEEHPGASELPENENPADIFAGKFHDLYNDDNYWNMYDIYKEDPANNGNPDDWTIDWYTAKTIIRTFRNLIGITTTEVHNENGLINALENGFKDIYVVESFTVWGESDGSDNNFAGCRYLNRADNMDDEQVIHIQPGVTLTVGVPCPEDEGESEARNGRRVKMDINDGVKMVLEYQSPDEEHEEAFGVLEVSKDSCVNVFGGLEVCDNGKDGNEGNYRRFISEDSDWNINFMQRIANFGGQLYQKLVLDNSDNETITAKFGITEDQRNAHNGENCWPGADDTYGRNGMAFLIKYAGLEPIKYINYDNNEETYWPSWERITYGEAWNILNEIWQNYVDENSNVPDSVFPDDYWKNINEENRDEGSDGWQLTSRQVDELACNFSEYVLGMLCPEYNYTVIRDASGNNGNDGKTVRGAHFTDMVTVCCDTRYLNENDNWAGCVNFVDCTFDYGVRVTCTDGVCLGVNFEDCYGADRTPVNVEVILTNEDGNTCTGSCNLDGDCYRLMTGEETGITVENPDGIKNCANVRMDECGENENGEMQYILTIEPDPIEFYGDEDENTTAVRLYGSFNGKVRIGGDIDVSRLSIGEPGWIEVTSRANNNQINLGGNSARMCDDCGGNYEFVAARGADITCITSSCSITLNGLDLGQPHVFGENANGVYLPLNKSMTELQRDYGLAINLYQGRWDNNWCNYNPEDGQIDYTAVSIDKEGKCAEEEGFDSENIVKMHLEPAENGEWITDPGAVCMTVTVNGATAEFRPVQWKPIYASEFVDKLNENINTTYSLDSLGIEYDEWDYLTIGTMKQILTTAYTDYYTANYLEENPGSELPENENPADIFAGRFRQLYNDDNYWNMYDIYKEDPANNGNPDDWTIDWYTAKTIIRTFRNLIEINSTEVHDEDELINALENGFEDIYVVESFTVYGEYDEGDNNFDACLYLNSADNMNDEQVIHIKPGVTLTIGESGTEGEGESEDQNFHRVKMDINDGVKMVLEYQGVDENHTKEAFGVLKVSGGSCVNVFGGLEVCDNGQDGNESNYRSFISEESDWNINFMQRIANFGGQLYQKLVLDNSDNETISATFGITEDERDAHNDEDCWPDDTYCRNGMALLIKYAGLKKVQEEGSDRTYWPSWERITYGEAWNILNTIWKNYIDVDGESNVPDSVFPDDYWKNINEENRDEGSDGWQLNSRQVDELACNFLSAINGTVEVSSTDAFFRAVADTCYSEIIITGKVELTESLNLGNTLLTVQPGAALYLDHDVTLTLNMLNCEGYIGGKEGAAGTIKIIPLDGSENYSKNSGTINVYALQFSATLFENFGFIRIPEFGELLITPGEYSYIDDESETQTETTSPVFINAVENNENGENLSGIIMINYNLTVNMGGTFKNCARLEIAPTAFANIAVIDAKSLSEQDISVTETGFYNCDGAVIVYEITEFMPEQSGDNNNTELSGKSEEESGNGSTLSATFCSFDESVLNLADYRDDEKSNVSVEFIGVVFTEWGANAVTGKKSFQSFTNFTCSTVYMYLSEIAAGMTVTFPENTEVYICNSLDINGTLNCENVSALYIEASVNVNPGGTFITPAKPEVTIPENPSNPVMIYGDGSICILHEYDDSNTLYGAAHTGTLTGGAMSEEYYETNQVFAAIFANNNTEFCNAMELMGHTVNDSRTAPKFLLTSVVGRVDLNASKECNASILVLHDDAVTSGELHVCDGVELLVNGMFIVEHKAAIVNVYDGAKLSVQGNIIGNGFITRHTSARVYCRGEICVPVKVDPNLTYSEPGAVE